MTAKNEIVHISYKIDVKICIFLPQSIIIHYQFSYGERCGKIINAAVTQNLTQGKKVMVAFL